MSVDLSRAVGWWEEWQLRILVLGSLFLFAGSMVRNLRIPMSRLCIWLAYLGADALAIYALATLFNRHKQPPGAGMSSSVLEVVWAPVLLIHLGGQHTFTAFSIEDNELWRRHIVTVVSQVTVALYVFCKSWPRGGDKRLLQAAIVLFVVGIAKLIQKLLTLKSASLGSVMTSSTAYPAERRGADEVPLRLCEILCLPFVRVPSADDAAAMKRQEEHQAPESACMEITRLVAEHVKDGWKQYIVDAPSYKRFNNFRGQWTLSRHKLHGRKLWWSLQQVPFDWSVLIWHLATELCLHHQRTSAAVGLLPAARCSKLISNYMIYLLFIRPEMLMPGTRQGLFTAACYDIGLMLKRGNEPPPEDARTLAQQILRTSQSPSIGDIGTMVPGACKVAEELMEPLEDEEERRTVIQGVWVEMLCCSASSCRGYLHAKSLGEGVEFLTFVWLLLSRMGMETFADKFQRPEPGQGQGEEIAADASASEPQDIPVEEEIAIV
ncbi:hypothetical protein C2845_PM04G23940 [Panicum miliaceum]|uniref:DUF4220 domain-containing protein n=1 Tax=Panicum miliaceum TaxID=4540 RepID=A0A3L6QNW4_PANMI|nr:hypothetical protein C2845_PM04G23940 [Panicum miliaceum]